MAALIADPFRAARLVLSLRRQGITDDAVLAALETVDRGAFVEADLAALATEDCAVPIACGQTIPQPIVTARLLRALDVSPGKENRILLVGAGSGYTAALLAQTCRHVFGVERYRALADGARVRLDALKVTNVTIRHGDGLLGIAEHGPYDRILLAGAVKTIPAVLVEQLDKDGVLVAAISDADGEQTLRRVTADKSISDEPMPIGLTMLRDGVSQTL